MDLAAFQQLVYRISQGEPGIALAQPPDASEVTDLDDFADPLAKLTPEEREYLDEYERQHPLGFAKFIPQPPRKVLRILRKLNSEKPERGLPEVSTAIRLLSRFRREQPNQSGAAIWQQIYPLVVSNYARMTEVERRDAGANLRQRVRNRLKARKRYAMKHKSPREG